MRTRMPLEDRSRMPLAETASGRLVRMDETDTKPGTPRGGPLVACYYDAAGGWAGYLQTKRLVRKRRPRTAAVRE